MNKRFVLVFSIALLLCAVTVQASTYAYIKARGKKLDQLQREISTFERLVKEWKNGEILHKQTHSSGLVFKKHEITVVFAGPNSDITKILTSSPYEGDFVKNVVVRYWFEKSKKEEKPTFRTLTKKFPNIRNAIAFQKGLSASALLKKIDGKHGCSQVKATASFFSLQEEKDNLIFKWLDGEGFERSINVDIPFLPSQP